MTGAKHKATVAKGIFGYVFENRDKMDNAMYRTLTHDLGIIVRGDTMALPYTAGMEKALEGPDCGLSPHLSAALNPDDGKAS